jgi:monoamine oxidase
MLDAIVIGAGAAGLAAARDLSSAGKSVVILEARQRIGGRIFTLHESNLPLPIELGAEFIHGEAEETFKIVEAGALLAYELPNNQWMSDRGKFRRLPDFWATTKRIRMKIPAHGRDVSFAEFLKKQRNLSPRLKAMAINFAEGYNAAHADRISAKSLRATKDEEDDPKQWRIGDGYDSVIESIRAGLDPSRSTLHLDCEATDVKWRRSSVEVATRKGESFRAAAAVITIPIGVWKSAGAIRFDPPLREKERAIRKLEVGHVVKFVFAFHERFWDPDRMFVTSRDPFMPTWWTMSPVRAPMLTGWAGGHAADRMLAAHDLTDRALQSLSSVFGVSRREIDSKLDSVHVHNWQADPFSRGAYSYAGVGGEHAHETLARQIEGTLFFAGEATTPDETGTVAGAIGTGRRAAKQLFKSLAK